MGSEFTRRRLQSIERTRLQGLETRLENKLARVAIGFYQGASSRKIAERVGLSVIAVNRELRRLELIPPPRERLTPEVRARRACMLKIVEAGRARRKARREARYA